MKFSHSGLNNSQFCHKIGLCREFSVFYFCSLAAISVQAQNYSVDWHNISGGGGTSTGATYQVTGTIGQHDASLQPMTGGNYSLTGGFWSLISVVQTTGAPALTITYSGNQAVVSWPSSVTGWTLQTNGNLATGIWGNYLGTVSNNSVTNAPPKGTLFFRLSHP